jgi:DNA-binding CsgD family transcriptional regulator
MLTQPEMFNMLAQKYALKLELVGLKHSRGSVYAHIKRVYGLRGSRQSVYTQFCELVEKEKGNVHPS